MIYLNHTLFQKAIKDFSQNIKSILSWYLSIKIKQMKNAISYNSQAPISLTSIDTKVHSQIGDTCYKHAGSTIINSTRKNDSSQRIGKIIKQLNNNKQDGGPTAQLIKQFLKREKEERFGLQQSFSINSDLKQALAVQYHSLLTIRMTSADFDKMERSTYFSVPYRYNPPDGHAMAIVGQKIKDGKQYWRVKNSWGENCHDKGYLYIQKSSLVGNKNCKVYTFKKNPLHQGYNRLDYNDKALNMKQYSGGIKEGGKINGTTFMRAKNAKDNAAIKNNEFLEGYEHPNVVKVQDIWKDRNQGKYVLAKKAYHETLKDRHQKNQVSDIDKMYIMRDCVNGLDAIQAKFNRNHGDIKSNNIAFHENSKIAMLDDFDLSKKMNQQNKRKLKAKDLNDLSKAVYKNKKDIGSHKAPENEKLTKQIIKQESQKNDVNYKNAKKRIQEEVILKEYRKEKKFERNVMIGTGVAHTINSALHDIHQKKDKTAVIKNVAKNSLKTGVGIATNELKNKYFEKITTQTILSNRSNYNFRPKVTLKSEIGFMAGCEVVKGVIDTCFSDEKDSGEKLKKGAKNAVINLGEFAATRGLTQCVEKKIGEKLAAEGTKKFVNFTSQTVASTVGKQTIIGAEKGILGAKNFIKGGIAGATVGFVVGTVADVVRGEQVTTALKNNGKSSIGSFIGGAIGTAIAGPVGSFVGGAIGGILSSWF